MRYIAKQLSSLIVVATLVCPLPGGQTGAIIAIPDLKIL